MSDQPILFCPPHCNHVCKSLRGLAQHTTHWPLCRQKAMPYLNGLNSQNPTFHQSYVDLDAQHVNQAMEPMWQQVDDPAAFKAPDSGAGEASLIELNQPPSLNSEMMDALNLHKTNVDDKISHQLSMNGLANAWTMLTIPEQFHNPCVEVIQGFNCVPK
jgi:hypothetical protein